MPLRYPLALCVLALLLTPAAAAQPEPPQTPDPFTGSLPTRAAPPETAAEALTPSRVLEGVLTYWWQQTGEGWGEPTSRESFTYDGDARVLESLRENRGVGGDWQPSTRSRFTRDALGRITEEHWDTAAGASSLYPWRRITTEWRGDTSLVASRRSEVWQEATGWYLQNTDERTYDGADRMLSHISITCNAAGEVQSSYRLATTYSEDGQFLDREFARQQEGEWEPYERWRYTYDNRGETITILAETLTSEGALSLARRDTYVYTPEGIILNWSSEETQDEGETWVLSSRGTNTYDNAGNRTEQKSERWNAATERWITTTWFQRTFNERGLMTFEDARSRNATTGALTLHYTNAYTYDEEGDRVEWVRQQRTQEAVPLQNQTRQTFSYRSLQVSTEAGLAGLALSLETFPNPAAGTATVRFDLAAPSTVEVSVYDLLGRRVATLAEGEHPSGAHALPLDAGGLAAGLYLVRLEAGASVLTRRLTVLR
jgi:hypothetical protein